MGVFDWIQAGAGFVISSIAAVLLVSEWHERHGWKWKFAFVGELCGLVVLVASIWGGHSDAIEAEQFRKDNDEKIAAAKAPGDEAIKENAKLKTELVIANDHIRKLTPRPLAVRVREVISKIDPKIFEPLKNGQTHIYHGSIPVFAVHQLQSLATEEGAKALFTLVPEGNMGIGGPDGPVQQVYLSISPSLIADQK